MTDDPIMRGEWRSFQGSRRRHYVYDGARSMCFPKYGRCDWQTHKGMPACPQCQSFLNEARAHRAAAGVAGIKWTCFCLHCRRTRDG